MSRHGGELQPALNPQQFVLFVPDNPNYEGSVKLLFDEHNHPISSKQYEKMPDEQKAHCQWRRCYKMVTLLHTNRTQDFYFFVAVKVVPGNDHECPILYELVKQFVDQGHIQYIDILPKNAIL